MDHSPILDYASPASRRKLRLPARSVITTRHDARRFIIRERLDGQAGAVFALLFAAFTFCIMIAVQKDMLTKWRRNVTPIGVVSAVQTIELVISAMVINSTWRRTMLIVSPVDVTLTFSAPFSAGRHYHWPAEQVAAIEVVDSEPMANLAVYPELELRMWTGAPVRLFAGHRRAELMHLGESIRAMQPPLPSADASPAPTAPPPHPHKLGEW
ncbi:MAG: hypothetical protein ABIP55_05225 [Tepidisphaeraceae bacterium]